MRYRSLLLGIWMTALFWPYPHAGGYSHAWLLAIVPLLLSIGDALPHWSLRGLYDFIILAGELTLAWSQVPNVHQLLATLGRALVTLGQVPPSAWNNVSAHLAVPILLMGALLGWFLFRQCKSYGQTLGLFLVGAVIIPLNHVLWRLPAEGPLLVYLGVGLCLLTITHFASRRHEALTVSPPKAWYVAATAILVLPLMVGYAMPSHRATDPLGLAHGVGSALLNIGSGPVETGYANSVTHIGHTLIPNTKPVLLIKTRHKAYWQAAVYSTFNGKVWTNPTPHPSTYQVSPQQVGTPLFPLPFNHVAHKTLSATVESLANPISTLFYPGDPSHLTVNATFHPSSQRFSATRPVTSYHLTADVPDFTRSQLALVPMLAAPSSMTPDLQEPSSLSPRVAVLAQSITTHDSTPWTEAMAIKAFLDKHYRYSYKVTPTRTNVVNHFLFKDKKGYCDQFSTAFILMMRSLGIPARWVVGYAPGTYSAQRQGYVIRSIDAHSWAEIWIAGDGWVPVDPTPGFTMAGFSSPSVHAPTPTVKTTPTVTPTHKIKPPIPVPNLRGKTRGDTNTPAVHAPHATPWWLLGAIALAAIATWAVRRRRAHQPPPQVKLWYQLATYGRKRVGSRHWSRLTPRQWGSQWLRFFPDDHDLVWSLMRLMEEGFYRKLPWTAEEQQEAQALWLRLKSRHRKRAS